MTTRPQSINLFRGYAFCVLSAVPIALVWSTAGALANESTLSVWLMSIVILLLVGIFFTMLAGLLFGLPLVAVLSRFGLANLPVLTVCGGAAGLFIGFAWLVSPPLADPDIPDTLGTLIEDTRTELIGFAASGAFAAAAFWFGASRPLNGNRGNA